VDDIDILGIDLGTTNSAIAIWRPHHGRAEVLRNHERATLTPSVVFYDPQTGAPLVGGGAIDHALDRPDAVLYSVKRFMGRTARDAGVELDRENVTFDVEEEVARHRLVLRVGDLRLTPPEVSAAVLRKLKQDATAALGRPVERAVITVPAYFEEPQRQATKEAGQLAGLEVPRIVSEPTASALAFGLGAEPQTVVVYDLGGGTFDVSVLTIDDGLFRVRGTSGDTHLGGDDFDRAIARWLAETFERKHSISLPLRDKHVRALLREEAARAKITLTTKEEHVIALPRVFGSRDLEATLDRAKLEELIRPFIRKTLQICDDLLSGLAREKGVRRATISQVLLVGGQTRTPAVKDALRAHFGWELNAQINPDEAVAQGAAVLGARLCGHLVDRIRLWDVTPLSLGVELASGLFEPIVNSNAQIPVEIWRRGPNGFTTKYDRQEQIRFRIFQGERPLARDNTAVGEVALGLGGPRDAGGAHVACVFRIDQDGILHVRAEDEDADGSAVEVAFDRTYQLTRSEIEMHKRDAEANAAEDSVTRHLLELAEKVARARTVPTADTGLLDQVQAAIDERNLQRAAELFAALRTAR
jgi:molecular chaperone DnaK